MRFVLIFSLLWIIHGIIAQPSPVLCGTYQKEQEAIQQNPDILIKRKLIEAWTQDWISKSDKTFKPRSSLRIPVVVHVVWKDPEENIPDAQIFSQIDALNEDYQGLNPFRHTIPPLFKDRESNIGIEFCLAITDPQGKPTTGIVRKQTRFGFVGSRKEEFGEGSVHYDIFGGSDAWDPAHYLNIWVAPIHNFLGYAAKPGASSSAEDGVVVDPKYFGSIGNVEVPAHLGRTTTHEVGHYFNLEHLWGPSDFADCSLDDFVEDTPPQAHPYYKCPTYPQFSCETVDQFMNFMDYVSDACMTMFTEGQKQRMMAALLGPRSGLLESRGCENEPMIGSDVIIPDITLFPNPANDYVALKALQKLSDRLTVQILNQQGKIVVEKIFTREYLAIIDLEYLTSGLYFVRIIGRKKETIKKLFIHK